MSKEPPPRGRSSPYSRSGLFPWGNTYDVPATVDGPWFVTRTPCHLRKVRVAIAHVDTPQTIHCGTCGRAWSLRIRTDETPPTAVWTA